MSSSQNRLTTKAHWDGRWLGAARDRRSANSIHLSKLICKIIQPRASGARLLELGAAPGAMLQVYARLFSNMTLDGIDISEIGVTRANELLRRYGVGGCVEVADLFGGLESYKNYDFVVSHGLIEHFENYEDAIAAHLNCLSKKGLALITIPNYNIPIIRTLLNTFSKETIETHYLKCMSCIELTRAVANGGGVVVEVGSYGAPTLPHAAVDADAASRIYRFFARVWNYSIYVVERKLNIKLSFLWNSGLYVVARKGP